MRVVEETGAQGANVVFCKEMGNGDSRAGIKRGKGNVRVPNIIRRGCTTNQTKAKPKCIASRGDSPISGLRPMPSFLQNSVAHKPSSYIVGSNTALLLLLLKVLHELHRLLDRIADEDRAREDHLWSGRLSRLAQLRHVRVDKRRPRIHQRTRSPWGNIGYGRHRPELDGRLRHHVAWNRSS